MMLILNYFSVAQHVLLFAIPWGFSRQEYWNGLSCPPLGDLSNPAVDPRSSAGGFFIIWATREAQEYWSGLLISSPNCLMDFGQIQVHWVSDANCLIFCHLLLFLPLIFPSIRVFSSESALSISWPKYWSFSFSISPSNEYSELISLRIDWFDLLAVQGNLKSLLQHHSLKVSFFSLISLLYGPTLTSTHDYWKNHSFDCTNLCLQSDVSAF